MKDSDFTPNQVQAIGAQRIEMVNAFCAKYGCQPDECLQEIGRLANGRPTWRVRRASPAELISIRSAEAHRHLDAIRNAPIRPKVFIVVFGWLVWPLVPKKVYLTRMTADQHVKQGQKVVPIEVEQ